MQLNDLPLQENDSTQTGAESDVYTAESRQPLRRRNDIEEQLKEMNEQLNTLDNKTRNRVQLDVQVS